MPQTNEPASVSIDLSGFGAQLEEAEQALTAFASGPAKTAAERIEQSFSAAASTIERELKRASRSGELDFGRLTSALASDAARFAVDTLFSGLGGQRQQGAGNAHASGGLTGGGGSGQPTNLTVNFAPGAEPGAALGSVNQIAAAIAQAAIRGGRFL